LEKKLTITGFEKHCKEKGYIAYRYATINQGYDSYESNMKIVACYDNVFTSISPNRVYFKNSTGCNILGFQRVKHIVLIEEESSIGDVYNIICESKNGGEDDSYTVVADVV
jgi:hypothetical protein